MIDCEADLESAFEDYLTNQDYNIITNKKCNSLTRPDTVVEKYGEEKIYEYKFEPKARDFYRLAYQGLMYDEKADSCYIVTRTFSGKAEEIAKKLNWGYIVFREGELEKIIEYNGGPKAIKNEGINPEDCPQARFLGKHDKNDSELAELESKKEENTFTTAVGTYKKTTIIRRFECPYCGKIEEEKSLNSGIEKVE